MDTIILFELPGSLDTLPCGGNLYKNPFLFDADGIIKGYQFLGFGLRGLLVKGKAGINLGRNTSRNNG